ncbi:MAG TPA: 1,6-anhydro-N-acetylmuramyl-L-alanine amidase AmpD [Gammaproteobacteria bacterium]|nr:1,6-anhydro-N-acetylmuramyl-L-alanine amidase AmpD [Gammaproteobacteria bacterium]
MTRTLEKGRVAGAEFMPSPNFDERPPGQDVSLIVIHGISLPPGEYGGSSINKLFTNCLSADEYPGFGDICELKVSSHFLIRRDGAVFQYVATQNRAWHAGVSSFEGQASCNDFSIGIELEGTDDDLYESAQYAQLCRLASLLMEYYPSITLDRIVGHSDIAPDRKTDPGPAFDWQYFRKKLASSRQVDNT